MSIPANPSLFADGSDSPQAHRAGAGNGKSMLELLYDGFYLVFLLKRNYVPNSADHLRSQIRELLDTFETSARRMSASADDVFAAKYAFCALLDETVLGSQFSIREEWGRNPLQLAFFGDQLAGENFFVKLDQLRGHGAPSLQALEIFHYCLLLGFQGKYMLEAPEKLALLTARLGDEIAFMRGKRTGFSPFWAIPDKVNHMLKGDIPLTYILIGMAALGLVAFLGLQALLGHRISSEMKPFDSLLQSPPQAAHITINLP
ncbi:type IVB secretion system protein IcmH/DotU [Chitinimonas sp. BJB300]|uniref:type IVB secretion system protein IcmH/DotU n=1 Tax=Chitinimonas sp. BJB300 TaxID=1559339 RepID=UPI000C10A916|nr:type IVB secretion system protein IcmH/DotU [Chitinimonas sp. BJB300]PHV13186.1 type VI secretion system protein ImpK [Chitinimonas sp. BJB300]TSJ87168.1 DotU family type IV/VI secretion system protein [Chitinimonas sp. BJB300]